jgi:hypothetical protein
MALPIVRLPADTASDGNEFHGWAGRPIMTYADRR